MSRAKNFAKKFNSSYNGDLKYERVKTYNLTTGRTNEVTKKTPKGYKELTATNAREYKINNLLKGLPKNLQNVLLNGSKYAIKRVIPGLEVVESKDTGSYAFYDRNTGRILTKKETVERYHENGKARRSRYRKENLEFTPEQLHELQKIAFVDWTKDYRETESYINKMWYEVSALINGVGRDVYRMWNEGDDSIRFSMFRENVEYEETSNRDGQILKIVSPSIADKIKGVEDRLQELLKYTFFNDKQNEEVRQMLVSLSNFKKRLGANEGKQSGEFNYKSVFRQYTTLTGKVNKYSVVSAKDRMFNKWIRTTKEW